MDGKPRLRTGWTTGACATAAARAAAEALLTGAFPDPVTITLPKGQTPSFALKETLAGDGWAEAAIVKDAGDDPDVTHLATVRTRVAHGPSGVSFWAGPGVGTVTKPGLPIPPGEPAINPAPRAMIRDVLEDAARRHGVPLAFAVTVGIDNGEEIAKQTWNPRLGIAGGLSVLGTTGIVRPFSCSAWIASIHRGIDVAAASGLIHVAAATGNRSEAAIRARLDLPDHAYLDMGDFAGGLLKYLRTHPLPRLTMAGGIGKMAKLAQGALDLHSGRSQVDFDRLAGLVPDHREAIGAANTVMEAHDIAGGPLAVTIAERALATVRETLRDAPVEVDLMVTDRAGTVLAHVR